MSGKLIVIEGLDGSGKSTQAPLLADSLRARGHLCRQIAFPDYDDPSSTLVKMYLAGEFGSAAGDVNAYAASTFYAVDRYAAYVRHWRKDYQAGQIVVAARYTTSNILHQMGKLPPDEWPGYLRWLEDTEYTRMGIPRPDLVIYLDMPDVAAQTLLAHRYDGDENKKDLHERDAAYRRACGLSAAYAVERLGWRVVTCADGDTPLPVETVRLRVLQTVCKELSL